MDAEPGSASFADSLERLVGALREESEELNRIERLSAQSFREWFDNAVVRVSAKLGITLARARALVDDFVAIGANARSAYRNNYNATRRSARRVRRRG